MKVRVKVKKKLRLLKSKIDNIRSEKEDSISNNFAHMRMEHLFAIFVKV